MQYLQPTLKSSETQSSVYPASPFGKKTQDSQRVDVAGWSFFLSTIPTDKLGRNDRISSFATPNERIDVGLIKKKTTGPKWGHLDRVPKPELNT